VNSDSTNDVNYWPGGSGDAYSKAGELLDDKVNYTYVYDAWGRLRQVKNRSTSAVVSEYRYNALGYRIAWHYDVTSASSPFGPDGTVNDTDPWYFFAYNDRWQKWGVIRGTSSSGTITLDANPKEIFVHHKAGAGGFGGSSYIDSVLLLHGRDTSAEWRLAAGLTL
jgi:YD repeat-containing protein